MAPTQGFGGPFGKGHVPPDSGPHFKTSLATCNLLQRVTLAPKGAGQPLVPTLPGSLNCFFWRGFPFEESTKNGCPCFHGTRLALWGLHIWACFWRTCAWGVTGQRGLPPQVTNRVNIPKRVAYAIFFWIGFQLWGGMPFVVGD